MPPRLGLVLAMVLGACSPSISTPGTPTTSAASVRLRIEYEDGWNLERFEVTVGKITRETDVGHEIVLPLPETTMGERLPVEVWGLIGGLHRAHGVAEVLPALGKEVPVALTLSRLPCGTACQPGAKACKADGVTVCKQRDADGCMEWSEPLACPADAPYCSLGGCRASCVDECAAGEVRCAGPTGLRRCGQADSDACLDLQSAEACVAGQVCSNGACAAGCHDECTAGQTTCLAGGIVSCGDANADGCREWSPAAPCEDGQSCVDGACVAGCADECTASTCEGLVFRACGQYDLDPCKDKSPGTSCQPSNACDEGRCTTTGCESTAMRCEAPPPSECLGDTLVSYSAQGTCQGGACTYTRTESSCPNCPSCNACAGMTCSVPPSECYVAPGTCTTGSCHFEYDDDKPCSGSDACMTNYRCQLGTCHGQPLTCTTPPAPECVGGVLRTYSVFGTCSAGTCTYAHSDMTCASGCAAGACAEDCTVGCATCTPHAELCDGIDNDCDGIADNGLPGCDPCAPYHELPVVTHFSNASGVQYLASDQASLYEGYPVGTYVAGACYPYYQHGWLPDLDQYLGDVWSVLAISDAEATTTLRAVCESAGVPVRLLRPDAPGTGRLLDKPGAVQVLHGIVVEGSLATVVLPPNWSAAAPMASYPIVANGFYDLNDNVFHLEGPDLIRMIALSGTAGRTGAVGILWNGGGALGSRTMSPHALDQFAAVVDFVAEHFSADRHRILMYGISRGGLTALEMASNPHAHDYTVTFAAASAPPPRLGELSQLQSTTFPGLLGAVTWSTGLRDAWRTGWTYPACAGKPALTGLTGPEAHLKIITGTSDPTYADAHLSLVSPEYLAGLKAAGTEVYLEAGTHDFYMPFAHEVEYGLKLFAAGIPLHADVLVRAGHFGRSEASVFGPVRTHQTWEALKAYVDPSLAGTRPHVVPGVSFYRVNRSTSALEAFSPPDGVFPFTFEWPRAVAIGERFPMVLVGGIGTQWEVSITPPGGGAPFVWTGTIAAEGKSLVWVDVGVGVPTGDYTYSVSIMKPGGTWQTLPSTNTIDGSAPIVTVVDAEPNVDGDSVGVLASGPRVPGFGGTNWGLSEY